MSLLAPILAELRPEPGARVWSLIVTAFGDLAQAPGGELSGAALTRIFTQIGVKPEALRVALHRLRKDSWIESRRDGRASFYGLTPLGRSQSQAASARIYGPAPPPPETWQLLLAGEPGDAALERAVVEGGALPLGALAALVIEGASDEPHDLLCLSGSALHFPDWARDLVCPGALCDAASAFAAVLSRQTWPDAAQAEAAEIAALRLLVVHGWRRLILRAPPVPDALLPHDAPLPALRVQVAEILAALPCPSLAELNR